jgi:outer membrane protein TolC
MGWFCDVAAAEPLPVETVVRGALDRDPALARAEADATAADGAWRAATGLRHNPTLEARLGFGLTQHELGLTQPLSVTGEGQADARAAEALLRSAQAELDRRRLEVAAAARRALARAIAADAAAARADEVAHLAADARVAAERRAASGDGPALEVHLARLDEAAAVADRAAALRARWEAREQLAATAGVAPGAELPADPLAVVPPAAPAAPRSDRDAAAARADAADQALRRERAAALPPLELGVWAQVQNVAAEPGPGGVALAPFSWSDNAAWTIGPSVTLSPPLWTANRAAVDGAAGARAVAGAELRSLDARIAGEVAANDARRELVAAITATMDPAPEARAALAGIDRVAAAGELGAAEAAFARSRVVDAWGRAAEARAVAAQVALDLALAESWPTLLP